MASRSFLKATLSFLGDLIQGKDRRAIDGLTKAVGAVEAARIAKQAGMKSRYIPLGDKPETKQAAAPKPREPGEDGDLIFVQSSNVHSFTYWNANKTLQVRFLGGESGRRSGPGPMYSYSSVPYDVWQQFRAKAKSSAGGAVWDEMRVRGSSSAHKFDYSLTSPGAGGTVPRKDTGFGLNPRELRIGGKTYKSSKPGTGQFSGGQS